MNTQCLSPLVRYAGEDSVQRLGAIASLEGAEVRDLSMGALVTWPQIRPGTVLSVLAGMIWITQEGVPADFVLQEGESLRFDHRGAVVAESLDSEATLAVSHP